MYGVLVALSSKRVAGARYLLRSADSIVSRWESTATASVVVGLVLNVRLAILERAALAQASTALWTMRVRRLQR